MRHEECRKAILEGEITATVLAHQESCVRCADFARDLERLEVLAPALAVASAPAGLADRVVQRMRSEWAGTPAAPAVAAPPVASILKRRGLGSSPWTRRFAAAAVAAAVIVAVVAGLTPGGPERALAESAEKTEAAGTAKVQVSGTVAIDAEAQAAGQVPDFAAVPAELHAHLQAEWDSVMRDFERQMAAFEAQLQRQIDEMNRHMQENFDRMSRQFEEGPDGQPAGTAPPAPNAPGAPAAPPAPTAPPAPPAPERPRAVSATVRIGATGSLDFADGLDLRGTTRIEGAAGAQAQFHVVAGPGGRAPAIRRPDGVWVSLPGPRGPLGSVVLRPHAATRILRSPEGEIRVVGDATIDGRRTKHYRFSVRGDAFSRSADGSMWAADVWIDSDGLLRRITLASSASDQGVRTRTELNLRLNNFGADVSVGAAPRASGRSSVPADASLSVYPFGASVKTAAEAGVRAGR